MGVSTQNRKFKGLWDEKKHGRLVPISLMNFNDNSNFMGDSSIFNSITDYHIATNFCTWHNSIAVVSCAKLCSNHFIRIWIRSKWNVHYIWIMMQNLLVKWTKRLGKEEVVSLWRHVEHSCWVIVRHKRIMQYAKIYLFYLWREIS